MLCKQLAVGLSLLAAVDAANIIVSNDDGWAEINVRTFFNTLTTAGNEIVLSAPATGRSGTGSLDLPATVRLTPCQFDSCPAFSPPEGNNASDTRLNYLNSFPVTSIRYGIESLSPQFFGGAPDIAVTGPNVGANLGIEVFVSGTVGAANEAVRLGIPAVAFSGASGSASAWNSAPQLYQKVYADLALNVTNTLLVSGKPFLPADTWLNVNFPEVTASACNSPSQFQFVLSRIFGGAALDALTPSDVESCGATRLPVENQVVATEGCFASISVGMLGSKTDADAATQAIVLEKLKSILTCLP